MLQRTWPGRTVGNSAGDDKSLLVRRVRESRLELRKFLRELKKNNPSAVCSLQYDKLYVNHRCYVWSDVQGRVVEFTPVRNVYRKLF